MTLRAPALATGPWTFAALQKGAARSELPMHPSSSASRYRCLSTPRLPSVAAMQMARRRALFSPTAQRFGAPLNGAAGLAPGWLPVTPMVPWETYPSSSGLYPAKHCYRSAQRPAHGTSGRRHRLIEKALFAALRRRFQALLNMHSSSGMAFALSSAMSCLPARTARTRALAWGRPYS